MKNNEYLIIPKRVVENRTLSSSAKLLYGLLMLYSRREGYCWAGNKHLSENCGCTARNITRLISELNSEGLIRIEEESDGKHRKRRIIYVINFYPDEDKNVVGDTKKKSCSDRKFCPDGGDNFVAQKNNKYNNKNYNYNYNNTYKNKNYFECEAFREDTLDYDELEKIMREKMDEM